MKLIYILLLLSSFFVSSCSFSRTVDVKSPCVSSEDGPCGPRKPVNNWMNSSNIS